MVVEKDALFNFAHSIHAALKGTMHYNVIKGFKGNRDPLALRSTVSYDVPCNDDYDKENTREYYDILKWLYNEYLLLWLNYASVTGSWRMGELNIESPDVSHRQYIFDELCGAQKYIHSARLRGLNPYTDSIYAGAAVVVDAGINILTPNTPSPMAYAGIAAAQAWLHADAGLQLSVRSVLRRALQQDIDPMEPIDEG